MKVSQLIKKLKTQLDIYGDIDIEMGSLSSGTFTMNSSDPNIPEEVTLNSKREGNTKLVLVDSDNDIKVKAFKFHSFQ